MVAHTGTMYHRGRVHILGRAAILLLMSSPSPFDQSCISSREPITEMFRRAGTDPMVANQLYELVRQRFRQIGIVRKRVLGAGDSLPTDVVVDEVFIKLLRSHPDHWQNREHVVRAAALAMQHVVINHLRRTRRNPEKELTTSGSGIADPNAVESDAELAVQDSISRLSDLHPQWATIVRLKHFGQLTFAEVATEMELTIHQVQSRHQLALAWLRRDLSRDNEEHRL